MLFIFAVAAIVAVVVGDSDSGCGGVRGIFIQLYRVAARDDREEELLLKLLLLLLLVHLLLWLLEKSALIK